MKEIIISLVCAMAIFLIPISGIMVIVGVFIFLDTAFGIWASLKSGEVFMSRKLERIALKMLVYQVGIVTFYGIDLFIFKDLMKILGLEIDFLLTKIIGLSFIGLEIFSIDEKIKKVKKVGIFHYFKKFLEIFKIVKKEYDNLK